MDLNPFLRKQHLTRRRLNHHAQKIKSLSKATTFRSSPKIYAFYKQYGKNYAKLFDHFYTYKLRYPIEAKYLPLCIVFFLHDKDYQAVFGTSTNGTTVNLDGFSLIIMTKRNPHLKRTFNHELHHVIFDKYYSLDKTVLYKIEYIVQHYKDNLAKHQWYAKKMNLRMHEESRTEFFAFAANHNLILGAKGLSLNYWPQKIKRVEKALNKQTNLSRAERRKIMAIYLKQYKEYLDDVYHYQCFVDWLFKFNDNKQNDLSIILSIITLQSMKDVKSIAFPIVNTMLKRYVERKQNKLIAII